MRAVIQRVSSGSVEVAEELVARIGAGLVALVGVRIDDSLSDAEYLADKIANLRIFEDDDGKMNRSLLETGASALVVSQFTLYGDARKGRRPGFSDAARGEEARALYEAACDRLAAAGVNVERGVFGADMQVSLTNDGPVTILLDSRRAF